jgi:hypothetical protein
MYCLHFVVPDLLILRQLWESLHQLHICIRFCIQLKPFEVIIIRCKLENVVIDLVQAVLWLQQRSQSGDGYIAAHHRFRHSWRGIQCNIRVIQILQDDIDISAIRHGCDRVASMVRTDTDWQLSTAFPGAKRNRRHERRLSRKNKQHKVRANG